MDRRRAPRAVDMGDAAAVPSQAGSSLSDVFGNTVASPEVGLAASANAFNTALITCVASCAFSLSERPGCASGCCLVPVRAASVVVGRRNAAAVPGRDDVAVGGREVVAVSPRAILALVEVGCSCDSISRVRSKDLRETTVAGVQVVLDATAMRTASTCA